MGECGAGHAEEELLSMSVGLQREAHTADQVRRQLAWLSAQEAGVRLMAYTRALTSAERAQLTTLEAESATLQRRLDGLTVHAFSVAQTRPARPKQLTAA